MDRPARRQAASAQGWTDRERKSSLCLSCREISLVQVAPWAGARSGKGWSREASMASGRASHDVRVCANDGGGVRWDGGARDVAVRWTAPPRGSQSKARSTDSAPHTTPSDARKRAYNMHHLTSRAIMPPLPPLPPLAPLPLPPLAPPPLPPPPRRW